MFIILRVLCIYCQIVGFGRATHPCYAPVDKSLLSTRMLRSCVRYLNTITTVQIFKDGHMSSLNSCDVFLLLLETGSLRYISN
jgi:hypothetical protein